MNEINIEEAKNQIRKLTIAGSHDKVNVILGFLLNCLPFGTVQELGAYAVEVKNNN